MYVPSFTGGEMEGKRRGGRGSCSIDDLGVGETLLLTSTLFRFHFVSVPKIFLVFVIVYVIVVD